MTADQSVLPTKAMWLIHFTWLGYINCFYQNPALLLQKHREQTVVLHLTNRTFHCFGTEPASQKIPAQLCRRVCASIHLCSPHRNVTSPHSWSPYTACFRALPKVTYVQNQKMQLFLQGTLAANKAKSLGDRGSVNLGQRQQSTILPFKILENL